MKEINSLRNRTYIYLPYLRLTNRSIGKELVSALINLMLCCQQKVLGFTNIISKFEL